MTKTVTRRLDALRWRPARRAHASYFLCGTPQSGSTILADLLCASGRVGCAHDCFSLAKQPDLHGADYARFVARTVDGGARAGIFGATLLWRQQRRLVARLRERPGTANLLDRDLFERVFPRPRFIWVRREDPVAEAVSWWSCSQRRQIERAGEPGTAPVFDFDKIDALVADVRAGDDLWRSWFAHNGIAPLLVRYQELAAEPEATARRALAFLDVDVPADEPLPVRTATHEHAAEPEWRARYRQQAARGGLEPVPTEARTPPRRATRAGAPTGAARATVFVCGTGRSGTSLLAGLLESTRLMGLADEYFHPKAEPASASAHYLDYVSELLRRRSINRVFGAKLHWWQLERLVLRLRAALGESLPDDASDREVLEAVFPSPSYVWIRRLDSVAQAVSKWKADQTGLWSSETPRSQAKRGAPVFDYYEIDRRIALTSEANLAWRSWFGANDVQPVPVVYEELVDAPAVHTTNLLRALGLAVPENVTVAARTERQADALNEEWIARYRDEAALGRAARGNP